MKKFLVILILFLQISPVFSMNIGTYKANTDYGLFDGFKFNFFGRQKGEKWVELKSETPEEIERIEKEKDKPKEVQDEHQLFRFIQEDTVVY